MAAAGGTYLEIPTDAIRAFSVLQISNTLPDHSRSRIISWLATDQYNFNTIKSWDDIFKMIQKDSVVLIPRAKLAEGQLLEEDLVVVLTTTPASSWTYESAEFAVVHVADLRYPVGSLPTVDSYPRATLMPIADTTGSGVLSKDNRVWMFRAHKATLSNLRPGAAKGDVYTATITVEDETDQRNAELAKHMWVGDVAPYKPTKYPVDKASKGYWWELVNSLCDFERELCAGDSTGVEGLVIEAAE